MVVRLQPKIGSSIDAVSILLSLFVMLFTVATMMSQAMWPENDKLYSVLSGGLTQFMTALFTALGVRGFGGNKGKETANNRANDK